MGKITVDLVKHGCFGNCVKISNSVAEVYITVDFGPRIISFSYAGMENIFYKDESFSSLGDYFSVYNGDICKLYGGHRLWVSPEIVPACYYPDNHPVKWEKLHNGASFSAPIENINFIQKSLTITVSEDSPKITITHSITNCGNWEIEVAPWTVTMIDKGAVEIMPMPSRKTGFLPNRSISLWEYSKMNDSRVFWGDKYIMLKQDDKIESPFKLGYNNESGWAAAFTKDQVFFKYFEPVINGVYPDNGCSYETYVNHNMFEMEALGPLTLLAPEESTEFLEEWEIYNLKNSDFNNWTEKNWEEEAEKILRTCIQ